MMKKSGLEGDDLGGISPLLTYSEAGWYLRKSAGFIRGEVYAGKLSVSRIGRTPDVAREELDRYIAERAEVGDAARRPGLGRRPAAAKATDKNEVGISSAGREPDSPILEAARLQELSID